MARRAELLPVKKPRTMSDIQHPKRQPWDITAAQKKALKAQGHALKGDRWVGQKGLTESVVMPDSSAKITAVKVSRHG